MARDVRFFCYATYTSPTKVHWTYTQKENRRLTLFKNDYVIYSFFLAQPTSKKKSARDLPPPKKTPRDLRQKTKRNTASIFLV